MKAVVYSALREGRLFTRNPITLFLAAAPAIMAVVFLLVFGAMRNANLILAVSADVSSQTQSALERVADVEIFDDIDTLSARVMASDSVAGIAMENGSVTVLVQGNERDGFQEEVRTLVGLALTGKEAPYAVEAVEPHASLAYRISLASILLLALFIGGAAMGMSIVYERENEAIRAVTVSPLTLPGYALSKLIPALLISAAGVVSAALLMGMARYLPGLLLLTLSGTAVTGFLLFVTGASASNEIGAIGVMKLIMPLCMIVPISSIFVPEKWRFFYWPIPMYWQYAAIGEILDEGAIWLSLGMTFLVGSIWFVLALLWFSKKTRFRWGR